MDWLRPAARLAIVGITPGNGTMVIAHQTAVEGLAAGRSPAAILNEVKSRAVFSGFRHPLITRLEYLGVHRHLGLQSAAELWTPAGERHLQSTSAIRYPAFVDGEDYGGRTPALTSSPVLRRYVCELLAPELARIPDALVIGVWGGTEQNLALRSRSRSILDLQSGPSPPVDRRPMQAVATRGLKPPVARQLRHQQEVVAALRARRCGALSVRDQISSSCGALGSRSGRSSTGRSNG